MKSRFSRGIFEAREFYQKGKQATHNFDQRLMRRKKKTTIVTFESRERMTIRHGVRQVFRWCERCGDEVLMVTPNEAAAQTGTDARTIFRGVESGEIHFIEDAPGGLLVCSRSLSLRYVDSVNSNHDER